MQLVHKLGCLQPKRSYEKRSLYRNERVCLTVAHFKNQRFCRLIDGEDSQHGR